MNLLDMVKESARTVGGQFTEPDDDWDPFLFVRGPVQGHSVTPLMELMDDKNSACRAITATLRTLKAEEAVFLSSAWAASYPTDTDVGTVPPPSRNPDRIEVVILTYVTADSIVVTQAEITRYEDRPPTLGEFEILSAGLDAEGRFADAMRKGIN